MKLELFHIFALVFSLDKLFPRLKEIFRRNDIIVCNRKPLLFYIFSMLSSNTPPPRTLPLLQRLKTVYQLWHGTVAHIPKLHRYTFGGRIDKLFLEILEIIFRAQYAKPEQKLQYLIAGSGKIDLLKFFLQIGWESKLINNKKYLALSKELDEIGRMLGGWKKGLETKLSP